MARNMIKANEALFSLLDEYCAKRSDPIRNAGTPRWVATTKQEKQLLKNGKICALLSFGSKRSLTRIDYGSRSYFCTIGFEHVECALNLSVAEVDAGLLTILIAEAEPVPIVPATRVRDIVEYSDKSADAGYAGHDAELVRNLFPSICALYADDVSKEETWRVFFLLCLMECRENHSWMDGILADTLISLCELELLQIPYRTLCRSIFDSDPAAMFLALYRCLEGLYAYSSSRTVIEALKLEKEWTVVAAILEDNLGWHPREETSLTALLKHGLDHDLKAFLKAVGETIPPTEGDLASLSARRIYKLRCELVHYRPAQHEKDYSQLDWNVLCGALTGLICHIYSYIYLEC
jgi:hypothetical protein